MSVLVPLIVVAFFLVVCVEILLAALRAGKDE